MSLKLTFLVAIAACFLLINAETYTYGAEKTLEILKKGPYTFSTECPDSEGTFTCPDGTIVSLDLTTVAEKHPTLLVELQNNLLTPGGNGSVSISYPDIADPTPDAPEAVLYNSNEASLRGAAHYKPQITFKGGFTDPVLLPRLANRRITLSMTAETAPTVEILGYGGAADEVKALGTEEKAMEYISGKKDDYDFANDRFFVSKKEKGDMSIKLGAFLETTAKEITTLKEDKQIELRIAKKGDPQSKKSDVKFELWAGEPEDEKALALILFYKEAWEVVDIDDIKARLIAFYKDPATKLFVLIAAGVVAVLIIVLIICCICCCCCKGKNKQQMPFPGAPGGPGFGMGGGYGMGGGFGMGMRGGYGMPPGGGFGGGFQGPPRPAPNSFGARPGGFGPGGRGAPGGGPPGFGRGGPGGMPGQ